MADNFARDVAQCVRKRNDERLAALLRVMRPDVQSEIRPALAAAVPAGTPVGAVLGAAAARELGALGPDGSDGAWARVAAGAALAGSALARGAPTPAATRAAFTGAHAAVKALADAARADTDHVWFRRALHTALTALRALACAADAAPKNQTPKKRQQEQQQEQKEGEGDQEDVQEEEEEEEEEPRCIMEALNAVYPLVGSVCSDRAEDAGAPGALRWCALVVVNAYLRLCFAGHSSELAGAAVTRVRESVARGDVPALERFPRAQTTTFRYFAGMHSLLFGDVAAADRELHAAFEQLPARAARSKRCVLRALVATRLCVAAQLPSARLLARHRLAPAYAVLARAVRTGDVALYDAELARHAALYARWGVYIALERARTAVARALVRRVARAAVWAAPHERVPVAALVAGARVVARLRDPRLLPRGAEGAEGAEGEQVGEEDARMDAECTLANLISDGLVKGYISHSHGLVVLSKNDPFPSKK